MSAIRKKNWPSLALSSPTGKHHPMPPPSVVKFLTPTPYKMTTLKKAPIPKNPENKKKSTHANVHKTSPAHNPISTRKNAIIKKDKNVHLLT